MWPKYIFRKERGLFMLASYRRAILKWQLYFAVEDTKQKWGTD